MLGSMLTNKLMPWLVTLPASGLLLPAWYLKTFVITLGTSTFRKTLLTGKYSGHFPHLTKQSWEHHKLQLPRKGEVLLLRLHTRTLLTQALLFKLHLNASLLCPVCLVPETCDHFLLCSRYHQARKILYQCLGISGMSPTLNDLCNLAVAGLFQTRCMVTFLLRTDRF